MHWTPQPAAAAIVARLVNHCLERNPQIATLAERLREETGTRLLDWIDFLGVGGEPNLKRELLAAGFVTDETSRRHARHWHPAGIFPAIYVKPTGEISSLHIKVESVDDFRRAMAAMLGEIKNSAKPGAQYRDAWVVGDETTQLHAMQLHAMERHGWRAARKPENTSAQIAAAANHRRAFAERQRTGQSDAELFAHAAALFDAAAADLGRDWACDLFFTAERDYWMSRNAAARVQYARQQTLGLGWANHDHHTYRSSRECFALLIALFERMGFTCRERFYVGREAGWGAQILEHAECGIIIFADVDLAPDEVTTDFAHEPLAPQPKLGTVGLWCMLHGEAIHAAGMHHLECQFDFDAARQQLVALGVETMTPFTNWPHLKQAFTKAEMWPVADERLAAALAQGFITAEQAAQFRTHGALGSHLEILERNDGFKGFNQTGISEIITRTDPRRTRSC